MNPEAPSFFPSCRAQLTQAGPEGPSGSSSLCIPRFVYITNLHKLVAAAELAQEVARLAQAVPAKTEIVFTGPRSCGCAHLVLGGDEQEASRVAAALEGSVIRGQAISATTDVPCVPQFSLFLPVRCPCLVLMPPGTH
eukprot:m51a1_g3048 hypothetical protein (138) ;mRNA; f:946105-946676